MLGNRIGGIASSRRQTEYQDRTAGEGGCPELNPHFDALNVIDVKRQAIIVMKAKDLNLTCTRQRQGGFAAASNVRWGSRSGNVG
jgi:hypothetical protein